MDMPSSCLVYRFLTCIDHHETAVEQPEQIRSACFNFVLPVLLIQYLSQSNASMRAFFLAMTLYPDAQRKAQAEIDAVVGASRLPDFGDRHSLPYVSALVKELLRWHIVAPIGVPHRVVSDDEYKGYLIPAGATIVANIWCVSLCVVYLTWS